MDISELQKRFTYHTINSEQIDHCAEIREKALALAVLINSRCPDSREKSTAITKLEEATFWAVASIARQERF